MEKTIGISPVLGDAGAPRAQQKGVGLCGHGRFSGVAIAVAMGMLMGARADAASPDVSAVDPPGGQRGTQLDVTITGKHLEDAREVLFYRPGIQATQVKPQGAKGNSIKAHFMIGQGCSPGEHPFRIRTATGLSNIRTFQVGPFPNVRENEPNDDFETPQPVNPNTTITGTVRNEDVDHFAVTAKKGQRISAEVEAMRLGMALFDPYIAILDDRRFELAVADDTALLAQDGAVSIVAPKDGRYTIRIRESSYGGGENFRYRLHVGAFPRPFAVFPAGGRAGEELQIRFLGDPLGTLARKVKLPAIPQQFGVYADDGGTSAPSPNWLRASAFPGVIEKEPNDSRANANAAPTRGAVAFDGILEKDGDQDWFSFQAKKDERFDVRVYGRRLRTPIDAIVTIQGPDGRQLGRNDDSGGPDSYLQFRAPSDGTYAVGISDHLGRGSAIAVYRIELTPPEADITLSVPIFRKDTQDRQCVAIPRGNRQGIVIAAQKENFSGDVLVQLKNLPEGVTAHVPPLVASAPAIPVILEAAATAPGAVRLAEVTAVSEDQGSHLRARYAQTVGLIYGDPNQALFYSTEVDRLAVAVTDEAPFGIEVPQPRMPLVQGGTLPLKVIVKRKPGFKAPIRARMLFDPPGVTSSTEITIPEGQNEGAIILNAEQRAQTQTWKVAAIAAAESNGDLWVASPHVDLEIGQPFIAGELAMTVISQGGAADVVCRIDHRRPFEGKAKIRLLGLPTGVAAEDLEFTKDDKEVVFHLTATEKSPKGQHKTLFCGVDVPVNGGIALHSIAPQGVLRIDLSAGKTKTASKQATPAKPTGEKPLSRLEELRRQQSQAVASTAKKGG